MIVRRKIGRRRMREKRLVRRRRAIGCENCGKVCVSEYARDVGRRPMHVCSPEGTRSQRQFDRKNTRDSCR
jgi:Fe-S-cluster-containing dehydrogenase component